jgi:hypothetical protein
LALLILFEIIIESMKGKNDEANEKILLISDLTQPSPKERAGSCRTL